MIGKVVKVRGIPGPEMTVAGWGKRFQFPGYLNCVWFDEYNNLHETDFHKDALIEISR